MGAAAGFRVFVTGSSIAKQAVDLLVGHDCEYAFGGETDDSAALADRISAFQPDALIVRKGKVDLRVLQASQRLKVICKHGVGVDNIDVQAATGLGIPVLITASANFESVAEHTLALLLALLRMIPAQNEFTRHGDWSKAGYAGEDLSGKTVGIVGLGRIGRRFTQLLLPFDAAVLGFDPFLPWEQALAGVRRCVRLEDMLPVSDILSIHCPLTPETTGLIGRREFASLKPGAWIVNTARGKIIDESELIQALRRGRVRGAALDTLEQEPPDPANPLLFMENVILTNHIAGSSREALQRMSADAVQLVLEALRGNYPDRAHLKNPEALKRVPRDPGL
jgi:D-3-phosphoglycerate dehydrogenase